MFEVHVQDGAGLCFDKQIVRAQLYMGWHMFTQVVEERGLVHNYR
jgi:hypothetical protein